MLEERGGLQNSSMYFSWKRTLKKTGTVEKIYRLTDLKLYVTLN